MAVPVEEMCQTTATIATRPHNGAQFNEHLLNDPEAALVGAGLPAGVLGIDSSLRNPANVTWLHLLV